MINGEARFQYRFSEGDAPAFPSTKYMGSKRRLVDLIVAAVQSASGNRVLDAFSGSGVVAYHLKRAGFSVTANDYLSYCYHVANATVANEDVVITDANLRSLIGEHPRPSSFIQNTFNGYYFTPDDNRFLDNLWAHLSSMPQGHLKSLILAALARACLKHQPRGIFTFTGMRYDDGRRDLRTSLKQLFVESVVAYNRAIHRSGVQHFARNDDVFDLPEDCDTVYLDPPYLSPLSDNDYTRRYHFVEGLMSYWKDVRIDYGSKTRKIFKKPSRFDDRSRPEQTFDDLFRKFRRSTIVLSYSSNGMPDGATMLELLRKYKRRVDFIQQHHKYSFSTHYMGNGNNRVKEFIFVGYNK